MLIRQVCFLVTCLVTSVSAFSAVPANKGIEVRVCQDRDCLTDGAMEAREIIDTLVKSGSSKSPVTVTQCGCLGPCGKGPNVDIKIDGVKLKDGRPGQSNYNCFRKVDSAEAAASMLAQAGIVTPEKVVERASSKTVQSTRKFLDFDRTTRIALQRFLYAIVALPMIEADKTGNWDVINGQVYPNSFAIIAALTFVGSQFMGTSSKANAIAEQPNE